MAKHKNDAEKHKTDIEVKSEKPAARGMAAMEHPFAALRNEVNRLFGPIDWSEVQLPLLRRAMSIDPARGWGDMFSIAPAMDLVERDKEYELTAELPGLTRDNIDLKLSDGVLTIKGEKTSERKEEEEGYYLRERSFGEFQRVFRLPGGVDPDKIIATFENGVLRVRLPKTAEAKAKERRIAVKAA